MGKEEKRKGGRVSEGVGVEFEAAPRVSPTCEMLST